MTSAGCQCETSAALAFNTSAHAESAGPLLAFSGAAVNDRAHAAVDVSDIQPPWQFYGTFHTHVASATSATITAQSVAGFANMIRRADGAKAVLVDPDARQTVGPLAYSSADVMTLVDALESMSFLFCLPDKLYLLIRAANSAPDIQALYRALLAGGFEAVYGKVLPQAFGLDDENDVVDLDLDTMGDMLAPQCVPVSTLATVLAQHRIGFYAADVDLSGITAESFRSKAEADVVRTHAPIRMQRCKPAN
ncbi:hypothetical protein [Burkholderia sp. 22PA0106]|uniref:hypothetical protein n=1 Tax=Burkholderia sp. 22PA0106 TaxID=3237371 RepID=UPI0039C130F8